MLAWPAAAKKPLGPTKQQEKAWKRTPPDVSQKSLPLRSTVKNEACHEQLP
eukprot:m.102497 g.102497  ORF g.102497 m.102497 type:complete len:51 (+) comp13224_c0_seq2:241-393(+)